MLEQVDDAIWIAEGGNVSFYGAPYPTRSVIVRLKDGGLWMWSPVRLTANLRVDVDRLGSVRHLVSPNKLHHLYLKEWKEAYPEAALWGPQSTIKKRSDLSFGEPLTDSPPPEWLPDIDQAWFRGSFAMDEIVFFHQPSGTAIVADLIKRSAIAFSGSTGAGFASSLASMASPRTKPARRWNGGCHSSTARQQKGRERRLSAGIVSASSSPTATGCKPMGMRCSRSRFVGLARDGCPPPTSSAKCDLPSAACARCR